MNLDSSVCRIFQWGELKNKCVLIEYKIRLEKLTRYSFYCFGNSYDCN